MGYHLIKAEQYLSVDPETAWKFLSDPRNLPKITPPEMDFKILEGADRPMFAGQIIHYSVSPFKGIRTRWVTEITQVSEGDYFVDEQRFGPYAMWHHQHRILPAKEGVCMIDEVHYKLPLGPLGSLMHHLVVFSQLKKTFRYREAQLSHLFGSLKGHVNSLTFKTI